MMHSPEIVLAIIVFVSSAVGTGLMRVYAQRRNLLDVPNQRSSHNVATPRGGGLSLVIVFLAAVAGLFFFGSLPLNISFALLAGGAIVAGVGFVDDHRHVAARWRFLAQLIAATFAVSMLGGLPEFQLGATRVDLGLAGDVAAVVFTVWLINLYNFMDGIDGIAAIEALTITGGVLVIGWGSDGGFLTVLLACFAAAAAGFLVWNWPPAKIFMGDVGSGFVGFVLATLAIFSSSFGIMPIWCWLILAGVFLVDATITLVTRVINGEEWYSAHNNHAYQKASRRLKGHRPVTVAVFTINLIWLFPVAWYACVRPDFGWWLTLVAWTPLVGLALVMKAGRPELAA